MRNLFKYLISVIYKPLLIKYLSKTRAYSYRGIKLLIHPDVFHPSFFFSTKLLYRYIEKQDLQQKAFLELGTGSGLIAMLASRQGARVVATDINPIAIEYLQKNSADNRIPIQIIHSDLFQDIPKQSFDIIAINPPYYKRQPHANSDYAWFCGENGEYFVNLFKDLQHYIHPKSLVFMILSDGCDLQMINELAQQKRFLLKVVFETENLIEKNFIFKIEQSL